MAGRRKTVQKLDGNSFDVVVIGGGSAGIAAAESAAAYGARRVCIIEDGMLGGECPTTACAPTKALLAASKAYYRFSHSGGSFGIRCKGVSLDFAALVRRKDAVVGIISNDKRLSKFLESKGIMIIRGRAVFEDKHTVRAGKHVVVGKAFVIATGSREIVPHIDGIETVGYDTYQDLIDLKSLPKSIAIVGGGPVGTEFSTFFSQLGVHVYLFQRALHILPRDDEEIAILAEERLRTFGVKLFTNTNVLGVKRDRKGVHVTYQTGRAPRKTVLVEHLALAIGKMPDFNGLELEKAGVNVEPPGTVTLDKNLRSNQKHIFAAGDASAHLAFTATAHYEGAIAGANAARVGKRVKLYETDLSVVPRCTFADPEIASVGMTPKEAAEKGLNVKILKAPMSILGRAAVEGHRDGMLKIVVDADTDKILGAHLMGERAGEVIHELALAIKAGVTMSTVMSLIRAYPTYSEIIGAAFAV